jgi:nucleoid-associated protein YgaU
MFSKKALLICGFLLVAGCAGRPQVELEIVRNEVAKAYVRGAKVLATTDYDAASAALHDAENLVYRKRFGEARVFLNRALLSATKATAIAEERAAELEGQYQADIKPKVVIVKKRVKPPVKKKVAVSKPKPEPVKPVIVFLNQVTVSVGETLFSLSSRRDIYGEPFLWPLIYKANRDQIKDPQQIYKGQVFAVPRDKSEQELAAARKEARESDLFPR